MKNSRRKSEDDSDVAADADAVGDADRILLQTKGKKRQEVDDEYVRHR